jgi:hypothetical protein
MRRIPVTTLVWLGLLAGLLGTLVALAVRRAAGNATPIGQHVNDLVATFEIPLQPAPGTFQTIPGWATLAILGGGAAWCAWRWLAQRARNKRS